MEIELSSLVVALTGIAAFVWGVIQANRSRHDSRQQQSVANELARREQDWEELIAERQVSRQLREDYAALQRQIRQQDERNLSHHKWDVAVRLKDPDVGLPPSLFE